MHGRRAHRRITRRNRLRRCHHKFPAGALNRRVRQSRSTIGSCFRRGGTRTDRLLYTLESTHNSSPVHARLRRFAAAMEPKFSRSPSAADEHRMRPLCGVAVLQVAVNVIVSNTSPLHDDGVAFNVSSPRHHANTPTSTSTRHPTDTSHPPAQRLPRCPASRRMRRSPSRKGSDQRIGSERLRLATTVRLTRRNQPRPLRHRNRLSRSTLRTV